MPADHPAHAAAMEGGGFYNRHSTLQAANLTSALPLLVEAARSLSPASGGARLIVDYGASQGRNSMTPVAAAIDAIREGPDGTGPISIVHTDLPGNDFASLFTLLETDELSYMNGRADLYPCAIGRSYFETVLPPESVDLGWSSNALHWLSRNPVVVPDHGWAALSSDPAARSATDAQLADDWERFLRARGSELREGGRLVCQFMGRGPDSHGFEWMAGEFWQAWLEMADEGLIHEEELLRMTAPSAGRSIAQIEAPFAGGTFAGLSLDYVANVVAPDPYWEAYRQDGDVERLGHSWAAMMRAANGPNFVAGLRPDRDRTALLDEMSARLARRIAAAPQRSQSYNVILVLTKTQSS